VSAERQQEVPDCEEDEMSEHFDERVLCPGCGFTFLAGRVLPRDCGFCRPYGGRLVPSAEGVATFGGYTAVPRARHRVKAKLAALSGGSLEQEREEEAHERKR
jgi:hypothetical protein